LIKAFFQILGPRFLAGGDFNSKHTHWGSRLTTTKGRELAKLLQANNYSFLSTGSPTYWPTDTNKTPDLLDFFITNGISTNYAEVDTGYDLTSDHSPVIPTLSTAVKIGNHHLGYTLLKRAGKHKNTIRDKVDLKPKLKTREDIVTATEDFISTIQQAAQLATPTRAHQCISTSLPLDIKRKVVFKRRARAKWQKTHAPDDRRLYNASNKLKTALRNLSNDSFTKYVSNLRRDDCSIWKPIKAKKKPQTPLPPNP
jgi:hypothetical protein